MKHPRAAGLLLGVFPFVEDELEGGRSPVEGLIFLAVLLALGLGAAVIDAWRGGKG